MRGAVPDCALGGRLPAPHHDREPAPVGRTRSGQRSQFAMGIDKNQFISASCIFIRWTMAVGEIFDTHCLIDSNTLIFMALIYMGAVLAEAFAGAVIHRRRLAFDGDACQAVRSCRSICAGSDPGSPRRRFRIRDTANTLSSDKKEAPLPGEGQRGNGFPGWGGREKGATQGGGDCVTPHREPSVFQSDAIRKSSVFLSVFFR